MKSTFRVSLLSTFSVSNINYSLVLNFSEMAEDRIVKFCARVDARSVSLVIMTNCPPGGRDEGHVTS